MTTFRLNLTGEYEGLILADCANVRLQLPDGGTVTVPVELATEVKPPLPPEHGPLAVVTDWHGMAWQREAGTGSPDWLSINDHKTWEELNADRGPLTLLVPDPAANAPELPLHIKNEAGITIARIEESDSYEDRLFVDMEYQHLRRDRVRELASALWAWAAREVQQP